MAGKPCVGRSQTSVIKGMSKALSRRLSERGMRILTKLDDHAPTPKGSARPGPLTATERTHARRHRRLRRGPERTPTLRRWSSTGRCGARCQALISDRTDVLACRCTKSRRQAPLPWRDVSSAQPAVTLLTLSKRAIWREAASLCNVTFAWIRAQSAGAMGLFDGASSQAGSSSLHR